MTKIQHPPIPAGWIGGFEKSNPKFGYPTPVLHSLPMLKNMDNIDLLDRQQAILWPEFSWETEPGTRCHQMFAPDISRVGYTNEGRVYSIICPQQGVETPSLGSINVEVTVTGQRGWVDETSRELACDMSVEGRVWFAPGAHEKPAVKLLWKLLDEFGHDLPITKEKAIRVGTHEPGHPHQPIFRLGRGESTRFTAPDFARHADEAWSVGHIEVQIGGIVPTHVAAVDDFNQLLLDVLNMSSGNMLKEGNVLTWNVWFNQPELVDRTKWRDHAEKWRRSIDVDQTSPDRFRSPAKLSNGDLFHPGDTIVDEEISMIYDYMHKHLSLQQRLLRTAKSWARSLHLLPKSHGG